MKILKSFAVAVVMLMAASYAYADSGWMRISLLQGDVQIKTPDSDEWGPASLNGPVMEGDQIWVPEDGRVELQLNMGTYVRLDQNSALQILATDRDSSQFYLSQGHAYVYFDAPPGSVLQVDTPDASSRAFDSAVFRIDMSDEYEYTDVAIYKGYVETENELGRTRVNAGDMISLGRDTDGEVGPLGPPDEWERWNKERNDRIRRIGESWRYLPPELRTYSHDFDADGRWVEVPEYGYCWTPTVIVGTNWSPYRDGRWIWRGGEYIWVSIEPWGWAPYHYGRWSFVSRIGWCWVPPAAGDVYWGPGYVGWVRTGDYVAWVPLAPGEIYYGHGHYGRHSVNITSVNINQITITNVYRNVHVNNGVTVVSRSSFATGSPRHVKLQRNVIEGQIFARKNISIGAPAIRPTKRGYFASDRHIPSAKLPPQRVRETDMKHLRQSRPFVKASDRSVFRQGARPAPLPTETLRTPKTPGKGKPAIQRIEPEGRGTPGIPERRHEPQREVKPQERRAVEPQRRPEPQREMRPQEKRVPQPERGVQPQREVKPQERKAVEPQRRPEPQREMRPQERRVPQQERGVQPQRGVKPQERKAVEPQRQPEPQREMKQQEKRVIQPARRPEPRQEVKPEGKSSQPRKEREKNPDEEQKKEERER